MGQVRRSKKAVSEPKTNSSRLSCEGFLTWFRATSEPIRDSASTGSSWMENCMMNTLTRVRAST